MSTENQTSNRVFLEKISSSDPAMQKQAIDAVNDFTRVTMREDGYTRRILPPITISDDQLDRQVDTDKPVKIVDKEPGSPGAVMVPFATTPMGRYIRGPRYRVQFGRIQTPKFTKDVDELRTYHMDIRQVISDNAIKDMLAEEDGKFMAAINNVLVGRDIVIPETQAAQWQGTASLITRTTLANSLKVMPQTSSRLEVARALVNNITIKDVLKWTRDEVGGDLAEDWVVNGFTAVKLMGVEFIITIKQDLVPTNSMFMFAEPKFLGKHYILEDATMFMDRRAYMIEFFAYESLGLSIGNIAAVARYDFDTDGNGS